MLAVYDVVTALLLVSAVAGLVRVALGPGTADRVLGTLLTGTTGSAALLVLGARTGEPALQVVALTAVLLAAVLTAVFVRLDVRRGGR